MAPVTFHLVSVSNENSLLEAIRSASITQCPYYVGCCQHWIHSPKTSLDALTGSGPNMQKWDYLIIADAVPQDHLALPTYLRDQVREVLGPIETDSHGFQVYDPVSYGGGVPFVRDAAYPSVLN